MTTDERNALVMEHMHIARSIASQYARVADYDDLVQAGALGLLRAADTYRPYHTATFGTWARYHVRAAMIRFLQELDPLSRRHRARIRRDGGHAPRTWPLDRLAELTNGPDDDPASMAVDNDIHRHLHQVIDSLPPMEQAVAVLTIDDGMSLTDTARVMKVTRQRIHQILQTIRNRITRRRI